MAFLNKIDLNDQLAASSSSYSTALMRYFYENVGKPFSKTLPLNTPYEISFKLGTINGYNERKKVLKGDVLDYELSYYLSMSFRKNIERDKTLFDSLFSDYLVTTKNANCKQILTSKFEKLGALKHSYLAKDITFTNLDGKIVTFEDLKGKVLYIDLWATWCAPCLANMPDSKLLMNKLKDQKDLSFVYINVKDSKKKWQDFIKKNNIEGIHLFADKISSEEIYQELFINGIPRYLIVDKDGKIIDGMALSPSLVEQDLLKAVSKITK